VKPHNGVGKEVSCDLLFGKNGDTMGVHTETCSDGTGFTEVVRGDLEDEYNGEVPTVRANFGKSSECSPLNNVSHSEAKSTIRNVLSFAISQRYINVSKKVIDEVEYDVYTDVDYFTFYVDKNGYLVRTESYDPEKGTDTITTYQYTFDGLSADMFKIDKNNFSESCEEPKLYETPDIKLCKYFFPPNIMCSFSMEAEFENSDAKTKYYWLANPSGLYSLAAESSDGTSKQIIRSDLMKFGSSLYIPLVNGSQGKCSVTLDGFNALSSEATFLASIAEEFNYISEEQVTCGKKKCVKYCQDTQKTLCIVALKSEPHHVVKYSYIDPETKQPMTVSFTTPKQLSDLSVFTLDEKKFPGCNSINSIAHSKPYDYCGGSTSSSDNPSSASTIHITFVSVIAAILATVLISLF